MVHESGLKTYYVTIRSPDSKLSNTIYTDVYRIELESGNVLLLSGETETKSGIKVKNLKVGDVFDVKTFIGLKQKPVTVDGPPTCFHPRSEFRLELYNIESKVKHIFVSDSDKPTIHSNVSNHLQCISVEGHNTLYVNADYLVY